MSERLAGRYQLLQQLGKGGMGEVWLARDLATGTECAVKCLSRGASAELAARLRVEFEALSAVRHPALVQVRELGFTPAGEPFLTMEFVPGLPADGAVARGDWPTFYRVAARVASALDALHSAGVVHGDVKPQNILVAPSSESGRPPDDIRLVDLGLAAMAGIEHPAFAGTRGFAAPEIARGEPATPASDLFGLGATLQALITGGAIRVSSRTGSAARETDTPSAQALEQASAPPALRELVLSLLAPLPQERPASAAVVVETLARLHPAAREPLARRIEARIFIGREREQARFGAALIAAERRTRVLLFEGEPGSGRSALVERLAARSSTRRAWVAEARLPRQSGPAAAALVLLRKIAAAAQIDVREAALPVNARAALAGHGEALDADDLRELAEAGVSWLHTIADQRPVLFADDFDQFDEASRTLLLRMALHASQPPVLWVWTALRFGAEVRALSELGLAERLSLDPFSIVDAAALAHARLGSPPPAAVLRLLEERGAGRPGLMVEWLRALAEAGALETHDGGVRAYPERFAEVVVANEFEDVQLARLSAAPAAARALAMAIAACGGSADHTTLTQLVTDAEFRSLEPLLREQVLTREDESIAFRSRPLAVRWFAAQPIDERRAWLERRAALAQLSQPERFALAVQLADTEHGLQIAEELWRHAAGIDLAATAARLAEDGGRPEAALQWIDRAVALLFPAAHYAEANRLLRRALEIGPADGERQFLFARTEMLLGRRDEAESVITGALAEPHGTSLRARFTLLHSQLLSRRGNAAKSADRLLEGAALAKESGDDVALAQAAELTGNDALIRGRSEDAAREYRIALDARRRLGDLALELIQLAHIAEVEHRRGRSREALRMLAEGITRARAHGLGRALRFLLATRSGVHGESADWSAAIADNEEIARLDLETGDLVAFSEDILLLAQLQGLAGAGRGAFRRARSAWHLASRHAPQLRGRAAMAMGAALRNGGRLRLARKWGARSTALTLQQGVPDARQWARFEYSLTCLALGLEAEARATLEAGREERGGTNGDLLVLILLGRIHLRAQEIPAAAECLRLVEQGLESRVRPYVQAHLEVLRAELAIMRSDTETARAAAGRALETFERLPCTAQRASIALDLARLAMDHATTGTYPVESWLESALPIFERLGDTVRQRHTLVAMVEVFRSTRTSESPTDDRGLLASVSHLLHSLSDLEELARRAMDMACERFNAERGALLLAGAVSTDLQVIAQRGTLDEAAMENVLGYSRRVVRHVTETGKSVVIRDATEATSLRSQSMTDMRLRSVVAVPLFVGGRVVGAVYLDDSRRPDAFSDSDRGLLEGFAHLMAVAIEQSRGQQEIERVNQRLVDENRSLRSQASIRTDDTHLLGSHPVMRKLQSMVGVAARQNVRVLITGESGTGKEFVAQELHRLSPRSQKPFIAVNCAAISPNLLESELFGIKRGIATGVDGRRGVFELADGGTLLLDEIGEMPLDQQAKLLRVLESKEVTMVGTSKAIPIDVRVIAATNADLPQRMRDGLFREDLFFRLSVFPIHVPPLRERKSDIPTLARHFVQQLALDQHRAAPNLSRDFLAVLTQSDWPGNVRELQTYVARIMAMTPDGELVAHPLPRDLEERSDQMPLRGSRNLLLAIAELERRMIQKALDDAAGNQSAAARTLGLTEQSLRYRLRKYVDDMVRRK